MLNLKKFTLSEDYIVNCECTQCGVSMAAEEVTEDNVCPYCEEDTEFLYEWANEGRTCAECGREIESGGTDCYLDDEGNTLCESCFDALSVA